MREPFDPQGRVNRSIDAILVYLTSLDEAQGLFNEQDVTFYWDHMKGVPGYEDLNFLCAHWKDFISKCNPSSFAKSWGADCHGWPGSNGFNSAGLFGQLSADTGLSISERFEVLFEMSRVSENYWAREMIAGLVRNHRLLDHETGDVLIADLSDQHRITEAKDKVLEYLREKEAL